MLEEIYSQVEEKMKSTIKVAIHDLSYIRTGKASITILDPITVSYYGEETPLNQVATLSAPQPDLLLVAPWDTSLIPEIEKAILKSNLGLNPFNDGRAIKIPIPPLSEERRKELVRVVSKISEEGKTSIRNCRRFGNENVKQLEKDKEISQDDEHRAYQKIQELTDSYIEKIEELSEKKRTELLQI
ncbi:ribosome recycling factor [bacterium (candidate division B38) B3_B38]|nr:MAG: ribosome recycling factor [bacterium (candidate division B38) B3_B38]